jgi:hypothetical protein
MLHMTNTYWVRLNNYVVVCRCGWLADGFSSRSDARKAGDEHLSKENAE